MPASDVRTLSPRRIAIASSVGAVIEWYDFFLYGTAAGLVFGPLFFSGLDGAATQFAAFGTFAVGFLTRPIGGLLFGHFGDRIGRKTMLLLTLVIMGVGTAAIGLLPGYATLGVWAPILLVTLRILQGIGVGGEYGGGVLMAVEYAPAGERGRLGSYAHIGVPGGLFLASVAFLVASLLPDEAFLAWGWRVCFLLSVVLLAVGTWIRLSVSETPSFTRVRERREVSRVPLRDLLQRQPKELLLGMGTRMVEGFTFNFFSVFLLSWIVAAGSVTRTFALASIACGAALGSALVPVTGALSDRWGRRPVYAAGALAGLVLVMPAAWLAESGSRPAVFVCFVLGLGVVYGTVYGPLAAFWSELFDTRYRFTALNTLYQVSGVLASGATPLIATALTNATGGTLWAAAGYGVLAATVSLVCLRFLPETRGRSLDAPPVMAPDRVSPEESEGGMMSIHVGEGADVAASVS